jgi:hypothetical protein
VEAVEQAEDKLSTGHAIIKSSAMSKEDLVLLPNGNSSPKTPSIPKNRSFNSLNNDFILSDCLDFVHAGVEAIIEDEVTGRFVAEELKVLKSHLSIWFTVSNIKFVLPSLGIFLLAQTATMSSSVFALLLLGFWVSLYATSFFYQAELQFAF